jgi:isopentenyldiphosphate isomerase
MSVAQSQDESFDVVDENDRVIGVARRGEIHRLGLRHRAVHIFWARTDGLICLQRRSFAKDSSPGLLSSSCAGHVDSGETYLQAAVRELGEELGVHVGATELVEVDYAPCHEDLGNEFVRTYLMKGDWTAKPFAAEVDSVTWRTSEEAVAWAAADPSAFATPLHHLLGREQVLRALRSI